MLFLEYHGIISTTVLSYYGTIFQFFTHRTKRLNKVINEIYYRTIPKSCMHYINSFAI